MNRMCIIYYVLGYWLTVIASLAYHISSIIRSGIQYFVMNIITYSSLACLWDLVVCQSCMVCVRGHLSCTWDLLGCQSCGVRGHQLLACLSMLTSLAYRSCRVRARRLRAAPQDNAAARPSGTRATSTGTIACEARRRRSDQRRGPSPSWILRSTTCGTATKAVGTPTTTRRRGSFVLFLKSVF